MTKDALRFTILAALLIGLVGGSAPADERTTKEGKIRELMEITGSADLGQQMMEGLVGPLSQAIPDVPADWWDEFMERMDTDALVEIVVPIYDRNLTEEELDGMLEFHRSPVGRSIIKKLPVIVQESMAAGQLWGEKIAEEMLRELVEEGFEVPDHLRG